jgi:hypothetical protein
MSLRDVSSDFDAAMQAGHVTTLTLAEFQLSSGTLYLTDCPHDVTWAGATWASAYGIGSIGDVAETAGEVRGLSFSLSGQVTGLIASALSEPIQGRVVKLRLAAVKTGGGLAVDELVWIGTLDQPSVRRAEDGTTAITITAEHMLARWDQPHLIRHSHADQQLLHPGDMFYSFAAKLADATVAWPNVEYFYK